MGQGLYTMLGYGVIGDGPFFDDDGDPIHDQVLDQEIADRLRTPYEASPDFLIFTIGVDDGFLQEERGVPDLPYDAIGGMVQPRTARRVKVAEDKLPADTVTVLEAARRDWEKVHAAFAGRQITLPLPGFILVSEWD